MDIKTLSKPALDILEQYLNFKISTVTCSIPYFNNKKNGTRAAFRVYIGKGNPHDIRDEFEMIVKKNKIDISQLDNAKLKKLLVENGLGIECSGFCYHILEAESKNQGRGNLSKNISFINCKGLIGQIRCSIRPVENCDVQTFASDANSEIVLLKNVKPGDIITMLANNKEENDHILLVYEVQYQNSIPVKISYAHAVAYPEDGLYNTGVRTGIIQVTNADLPLQQQAWIENGKQDDSNILFKRIQTQKTELRRLRWN